MSQTILSPEAQANTAATQLSRLRRLGSWVAAAGVTLALTPVLYPVTQGVASALERSLDGQDSTEFYHGGNEQSDHMVYEAMADTLRSDGDVLIVAAAGGLSIAGVGFMMRAAARPSSIRREQA